MRGLRSSRLGPRSSARSLEHRESGADLPDRLWAIPENERTRFFTELGEQAAGEIEELQMQLAGPDPVGERYLEKVGRLNAARMQAEEKVLAELILVAPEDRGQGIVGTENRSKRLRARRGRESSGSILAAADEFGEDLRGRIGREDPDPARRGSRAHWPRRPGSGEEGVSCRFGGRVPAYAVARER